MSNLSKTSWNFPFFGSFDHWINDWKDFYPVPQQFNTIPPINILEGIMHFDLEMAIPGVAKESIKIEVDSKNNLSISTESKNESNEERKGEWRRREFSFQSFSKSIPLPSHVDVNHITAAYENGVLKIHVPKLSAPGSEVVQKISVS